MAEVGGVQISEIERASWLFHGPDRDAVGIDHGGLKACLSKQFLDDSDIVVGLQEVGCEGVAKGVGGDTFWGLMASPRVSLILLLQFFTE